MISGRFLLPFLLTSVVTAPATAQDRFGTAVAVHDGGVLVLKPGANAGPATVFVYRAGATGGWEMTGRLRAASAETRGEGLGSGVAAARGIVLVAGGDPEANAGAHLFRLDAAGAWAPGAALMLRESLPDAEGADHAVDLGSVMRILQPPRRVVAFDGERAIVAVVTGEAEMRGVRIARWHDGRWNAEATLEPPEDLAANDQFGAALAIQGNRALVAAPRYAGSGVVFLYSRDAVTSEWRMEATLAADDLPARSLLGAAVVFDGERVLAGAPGTREAIGTVVEFARDTSNAWGERRRIAVAGAGNRFGSDIAVDATRMLVGAPGTDERRGAVYVFARGSGSEAWRAVDTLSVSGNEPGFALGTAVALGPTVAVAGAPFADGAAGRAAVFGRRADGSFTEGVWLAQRHQLASVTGAEAPCADGRAAGFSCADVDLLAYLPVEQLGGAPNEGMSDLWGWTDPETGREYALVGRSGGAAFVDISNPTNPIYLGAVESNRSGARDLKVYRDHLFFTGDGAGNHGLVVFDLTRLRDVGAPPVAFRPDTVYDGIASAHNLAINTESGFAYAVGSSGGGETCGGGLHMVNIQEPQRPTFAGCYTDTEGLIWQGRTHDVQCVVYHGPDEDYRGREICLASNETALRIVDVTDKATPVPISVATYPGLAYVHQGWLTEDQRFFYLDDELDELVGLASGTRTMVWDLSDLDDPELVAQYVSPESATDHNLYIKGNRMYQANYQAGLRVVDISDRTNPVEVGFFDTTPYEGNPPGFNGAWTAYPFFESGTVIVSSMREGLFVLRPQPPRLVP